MRNLKVFTTQRLPDNPELMATVASGYVGTRIFNDAVYVSGVFNGKNITSHRAAIPSTIPTTIVVPESLLPRTSRLYSLNVEYGVFIQEILSDDGSFVIYERTYAHRKIRGALITEISFENKGSEIISFTLNIEGKRMESSDFHLREETFPGFSMLLGETKEAETVESGVTSIAVAWSPGKKSHVIEIKPTTTEQKMMFVSAYASSLDSEEPAKTAKQIYQQVVDLWHQDNDTLFNMHKTAWEDIWQSGSIDIEGDDDLAQVVYGSLYYIISSIHPDWPYGLSPAGLASDGYMGHTFWDQDTWMYPPLLLLHDDLAKSAMQYRINRIDTAKKRALKYGYKGTMFPWESALTGFEVCPEPDPYSKYEHHVTGDVGFAAQQYWMATHDRTWFNQKGKDLIGGVAEFWVSRVSYDEKGDRYLINHVQGPDEYHYDINNSVYTNVIAKINLEFAATIFESFGLPVPKDWKLIAEKLYIPFDSVHNYHPEFDGYNLNMTVKQADVILLGFPLMYDMPHEVRRNDISLYEARTDPNGPAMTKSMFSVGWLEIKEFSEAARSFKEGYENVQEPFKIWTETPEGGEINFITGAGGFLQSVVFGYGGIRLKGDGLYLDPRLPGTSTTLSLKGVKYLGNSIDIVSNSIHVFVTLANSIGTDTHERLVLVESQTGVKHTLEKGKTVTYERGPAVIKCV